MKRKKRKLIIFALLLAAILQAQTTAMWTGNANDGKWETASNWSTSTVPDETTEVVIPALSPPPPNYYPNISNNIPAKAKKVTVNQNATLTLEGTLEVKEDLTNNGTINTVTKGTIKIGKNLTNMNILKVQKVEPTGDDITIKGTNIADNISIEKLNMPKAGDKTLTLEGKIKTALTLSGTEDEKKFLKIKGGNSTCEITLTNNGEGSFLEIDTEKVKIMGGKNFTAKNSKLKDGSRPDNENPQNGWIFTAASLKWTGSDGSEGNKWEKAEHWEPKMLPSKQDTVTIPSVLLNKAKWPKVTASEAKAKKITLESGGSLDLDGQTISAASDNSEMEISGKLKLQYTDNQKTWFKQMSKITLKNGSEVEINGNGTPLSLHNAETSNTGFKNLTINRSGSVTVTTDSEPIKVKKEFKVTGTVTLNAELTAETVTVGNSGASLTANKKITVNSKLENNGTFKSEDEVILSPSNGNMVIKVADNMTQDKTEFKKLTCQNAGRKTLSINGKIKVTGDLTLSGTSSDKLTINGSNGTSAIYLTSSQNDKGKHLKINTDSIKINEGDFKPYYKMQESTDNSGKPTNKNGWVFDDTFELKNSFMKVNGNELYIVFKRNTEENEFIHSKLEIKKGSSPPIAYSLTSPQPVKHKTISGTFAVWKYTLNKNISADEILQKDMKIEISHFNKNNEKFKISDIGIGLTDVLFAANSRTVRDFSGEKELPKLNTAVVTVPAGSSKNVKLYLSFNKNGFWYPSFLQPLEILEASENKIFSEYSGETEGAKIKFTLVDTDSNFKEGTVAQFMFVYDNWLPCARLKHPSDIFSFDVWKFQIIGVQYQRGGVSIFNNVINPDKEEKVSLQVSLQKRGILTIQIMTLDGSIVKTLERSEKSAGTHFYYWDGKNNSGISVARGLYFIKIAGPNIDESRKVMIIKN
nr:FlgD immunoglobulin-like domain containing protein [Treponema pedis]